MSIDKIKLLKSLLQNLIVSDIVETKELMDNSLQSSLGGIFHDQTIKNVLEVIEKVENATNIND